MRPSKVSTDRMHQHILALLEPTLEEQRLKRRHPVLGDARRFDPREGFGLADDHFGGNGNVFGIGTLSDAALS